MSEEMEKKVGEVPEAKVEGLKLEWGPELGRFTWEVAQNMVMELNGKLSEGENPWRIPRQSEFERVLEEGSLDRSKYKEFWSINKGGEDEPGGHFQYDSSGKGHGWKIDEKEECLLMLVRDAA